MCRIYFHFDEIFRLYPTSRPLPHHHFSPHTRDAIPIRERKLSHTSRKNIFQYHPPPLQLRPGQKWASHGDWFLDKHIQWYTHISYNIWQINLILLSGPPDFSCSELIVMSLSFLLVWARKGWVLSALATIKKVFLYRPRLRVELSSHPLRSIPKRTTEGVQVYTCRAYLHVVKGLAVWKFPTLS